MLQQAVLLIAVCMLLHSRIASCSKSLFLKHVLLLLSLSSGSQTFSLVSHFSQITIPPSPMVPSAGQGTGGHKVGSQLLPLCVWHSLMSKFLRHVLVFKASANACAQAASSIFYNSMWFCTRIFQWSHCPAFIILWNFLLLTSPSRVGITPSVDFTIHSRDHTNARMVTHTHALVLPSPCSQSKDHTNVNVVHHAHLLLPSPWLHNPLEFSLFNSPFRVGI